MTCVHATPRVFLLACLVLVASVARAHGEVSIATDRENYQAGETVVITGTGWSPGETVSLTVLADSTQTLRAQLYAIANASGEITNSEFVVEPGDADTVFRLLAEGQVSGATAETIFLDGQWVQWVSVGAQSPSRGCCCLSSPRYRRASG